MAATDGDGSCAGERRRRWMSWCGSRGSKSRICSSMMTAFSRSAWRYASEQRTPEQADLLRQQILWSAILAAYFVVVYLATNVLTAYRASHGLHVPTFWFAWEK